MFYQLGLRQFGDFSRIKLDPPPSLREMIQVAIDAEDDLESSTSLNRAEVIDVRSNFCRKTDGMLMASFLASSENLDGQAGDAIRILFSQHLGRWSC